MGAPETLTFTRDEMSDLLGALTPRITLLTNRAGELELVGRQDDADRLRQQIDRLYRLREKLTARREVSL